MTREQIKELKRRYTKEYYRAVDERLATEDPAVKETLWAVQCYYYGKVEALNEVLKEEW